LKEVLRVDNNFSINLQKGSDDLLLLELLKERGNSPKREKTTKREKRCGKERRAYRERSQD